MGQAEEHYRQAQSLSPRIVMLTSGSARSRRSNKSHADAVV